MLTARYLFKCVWLILIGTLYGHGGFSQKSNQQEILENKDFLTEVSFTMIRDKILIPVQIKGETFRFYPRYRRLFVYIESDTG